MKTTERVDELERSLAARSEGLTRCQARILVLEASVRHKDNQIKWLRISRDNWKLRAALARAQARTKSRSDGSPSSRVAVASDNGGV